MKTTVSRFFHSIAGKVFCVLTLCIVALLLFNLLLNQFVFAGVYENEQRELLVTAFNETSTAVAQRKNPETVLSRYHTEYDMDAFVWSDHLVIYTTDYRGGALSLSAAYPSLKAGTYIIQTRSDAPVAGNSGNGMILYGKTREGIHVTLRVPLADMQQSAAIANRFLWWSALATLLVSALLAFFLSRVFTRPVRRLSAMANRMANMDFSDRYTGGGKDELADLGQSLNTVSEVLEQNLAALKTANARLQSDVELTTRQNEARTRFIRNVSHELKTPISLIQTYAEGLHENVAADPADRDFYCTVIEDEAQKLSQIIAKLTMLMQLEAGGEELTIERFDIAALLTRLVERHAPLFAEREAALPSLPSEPLFVWGDALLMEQVFTNFLTNALHHVSTNGEIRFTLQKPTQDTLRVTVFNTGTPIPDEELPHIWESFYKVDKARTRAYGGTGIGLSVVAAIMQAHRLPYGVENREDGVAFFADLQL